MGRLRFLLSVPALIHLLILRPFLKLLLGVHVEGRENLTGLEQFILVANHNSHLDVLLLFHVLPARHLRRTHPVAAHEYFSRSRVLLWLVGHLLQPVWIVRGDRSEDPLAGMRKRLLEGRSIVIFPEGTRGEAGEIARFKTGVGRLAEEFPDVPIVPVFLAGPEKALPKAQSLLIPVWNAVTVGPPRVFRGTPGEFTADLELGIRELAASGAGSRHRRATRAREVPTIAVLGIDGSGKSTLSRLLAQRLSRERRACLVTDIVEVFEDGRRRPVQLLLTEKLRASLGRRAKTADSLKSYKIPKLAELLLRDHIVDDLRRWYAPDVIVLDGSPLLNIAAWARLYREESFDDVMCLSALKILSGRAASLSDDDPILETFPELVALKRLHLTHMDLPDAVLFLDVEPAVSMERILSRGEVRQVHETEEKLAKLRGGYRMVCRVLEGELGNVARTLDGHQSMETVTDAALRELSGMDVVALRHLPELKEGSPHA
jgi:1-acyl-sn-glycerol-3-phosphate acyltransferase